MIKNYVELPRDEYNNRAYTASQPVVIKARVELGKGTPGTLGGVATLHIIEPKEIKDKWSRVLEHGWKETTHSVGFITEEKWKELVGLT